MLKTYADIYQAVSGQDPVRIAVANPTGKDILNALDEAHNRGWIEPLLINRNSPEEAAIDSVASVTSGEAMLLMKGNLDTSILLNAILDKNTGLRTENHLTHVAVVEAPAYNRLMLMTDGGVNPEINMSIAPSLIENTYQFASSLGIDKPNIGMMALVEKATDKLPETILAQEIVKKYRNEKRFNLEGPIPLDIALSSRAAEIKGYSSQISGKTDIFIGPSITAINFTVKALLKLGNARGGGLILGAQVPVVLLSRSDSAETKLNSIALGLIARKGAC